MSRSLEDLSVDDHYALGLDVLLNVASTTALTRRTGLSLAELQQARDRFLRAARRGLELEQEERRGGTQVDPARSELAPAWFELGDQLAALGQFDRAYGYLVRATELDPGNGLYRKGLALFLFQIGRFDEAAGACAQALERLGTDPECDIMLARIAWLRRDDQAAAEHLGRACRHSGLPSYALQLVVDLLVSLGQKEEALHVARREAGGGGDSQDGRRATHVLAGLLQRLGRMEEARDVLARGIETYGVEEPFVLQLGALECAYLGQVEQGLDRLRQAVRARPLSVPARVTLAEMLAATHGWDEAEQNLLRAAYGSPGDPRPTAALLELYSRTNHPEKLRYVCDEILRSQPGNVPVRLTLVQGLMDSGEFASVAGELAILRDLAPMDVGVVAVTVHAEFDRGDEAGTDAAEQRLQQILARGDLLTGELGLVLRLCRYLRLNGAPQRALRILSYLPRPVEQSTEAQVERAMALVEVDRKGEALPILEAMWRREPHDGFHGTRLASHLATVHEQRDRALEVLQQTRRQAWWSDDFTLSMAATAASLGETEDALDVVYDYFVARGRPIPATSYLHQLLSKVPDDGTRSRERNLTCALLEIVGSPARQGRQRLPALRALVSTDEERRVLTQIEAGLASAAG